MFDKRLLCLLGNDKKYIWYTTVLMTVGLLANITVTASICYAIDLIVEYRTFGSAFHIAMNGASAGNRILDLLEQPDPEWGNDTPEKMELKMNNVTFSYDGRREILKNINMRFPEKGMTAVVGESGCGKSTVAGILSGALRPLAGTVCAGEKEICAFSREAYYRRFGLVSCSTYLFNETVRDNFLLACRDVSEEKIYAALEKVNLADFIRSNGGLDQMISEDGGNISGGQKQRLALAVNLAADKDVYIFDEATSNIDIESEQVIMKNIKQLAKQKSVIVISHRLENIVPADLIYFMESGIVRMSGSHRKLMETCAGYAKLYTIQKNLEKGYMGVTVFGAAGIAKALGEDVGLSYQTIAFLAIACGICRGLLRFLEQYGNHYMAFKLLALLRDKIFTALRELCPAKLESRKKGSVIAMITSDIETLEVFYAHTVSPVCIRSLFHFLYFFLPDTFQAGIWHILHWQDT